MSAPQAARSTTPRRGFNLSYRTALAIVIAVLVVVFIVLNRDETRISFIFFHATTKLWVALTVAAAAGALAGFLVSRHRYTRGTTTRGS